MNGSNPIFPLIGTGQAASLQADQPSEGENTAFAENLTAALMGQSVATVVPTQQKTETPIATFQGGLAKGSIDVTGSAGHAAVGSVGHAAVGSAGHAAVGSAGSAAVSANAEPAGSNALADASTPVHVSRTADVVNATQTPVSVADVDRASVDIEGVSPESSTAVKTDRPALPDTQHQGPVPVDAVANRPSGDVVLDHHVPDDDARSPAFSAIGSRDRQSLIMSNGPETARLDQPIQPAAHGFGGNAPSTGVGLEDIVPSEEALIDTPLDGATRLKAQTVSASAMARTDQAGTMPAPPSLPVLKAAAPQVSVHANGPEPLQPVIEKAIRPDAGMTLQHVASGQVASHMESALSASRPQVGTRKDEAGHHVVKPFAPTIDPSAPSEDRPAAGQTHTASAIINEAAGKSGPGAQSGSAVQTTIIDGNPRPMTELGGFDRLQSALSAEALPLETLRSEAASSLGLSRGQAPTAHTPAGAQIALQIVRSVPEGGERFSVHLRPAEMGSVDIQLNFESGGRLSAMITAERPETLELLQRDSRLLERSLGDSGLKLANDGLSFALKQDHQQQQHGQGFNEQAQARQAAFRAGRAHDNTQDIEQMPPATRVDGLRLLDIET